MLAQIITIILGFIAVAITLIVVWRSRKGYEKIDADPNAPIVDTPFRREFTDGHAYGLLRKNVKRKNGCNLIEMIPIDNYQSENSQSKIKPIRFIAKSTLIKPFGRSEYSDHREVIKILPPVHRPQSIPEKMRNSEEGRWANTSSQKAFLEDTFGSIIKTSAEAITKQAVDLSTVGLSRLSVEQIKDVLKRQQVPQYPEKTGEQK